MRLETAFGGKEGFPMSFLARFFPDWMGPYAGRIVLTVLGFVVAILFLTIGFWPTILILALCVGGFLLGKWEDGAFSLARLPQRGRWKQ